MKLPSTIAANLYWTQQKLRGRSEIKSRLEWLEKTQFLSPEAIGDLQLEKLRAIIQHAYDTVPYYRNVMDERDFKPGDIASTSDLVKLPLLTRSILRSRQDDLLSKHADTATLQTNFSSGSTGMRAEFKQDLNFRLWMRAHQLRTYQWCSGWRLGQPFVLLWGSEIYWNYKQVVDQIDNLLCNRREFNTFKLSNDLIGEFLNKLARFRPVLVSTYTNAMHLIAKEAETRNLRIEGLKAIQSTSEPLPPAIREQMSRIFGCEIYDKYGSRETNIVCHESPNHEGMCIQSENVVVEIVDDDGIPCSVGQVGRIVLTTLNNLSMPLIRYETTDLASLAHGYCSSGIGLPRMSAVRGRLQDLILTPSGDHIDAYFFSYLFMRYREIHWFQVVQREISHLLIRIYTPANLSRDTREEIADRILHHTGFSFRLDFEILKEMPQSSTGKFRLCVSELADPRAVRVVD